MIHQSVNVLIVEISGQRVQNNSLKVLIQKHNLS